MVSQALTVYRGATIAFSVALTLMFLKQALFNVLSLGTFVRALFGLGLAVVLGALEFREIHALDHYASFYYSYPGRGALFLLFYGLLKYDSVFSFIAGVLLWPMALVHVFLQYNPDLGEPAYFNGGSFALSSNDLDEDVV